MARSQTNKSIDFDQVAELYDVYVNVDFDVAFWQDEAHAAGGPVLELMCGSGRIGLPLIQEGLDYTGLDYSQKLLDRFSAKLTAQDLDAQLVYADARTFELTRTFDLIFIGFHSLSEVLDNRDKLRVLRRVREHLAPGGCFTFSLHNPRVRAPQLTGKQSDPMVFQLDDGDRILEFRHCLAPPSRSGMVRGKQFYLVTDSSGRTLMEKELAVQFHLVTKAEVEKLLTAAGFVVQELWGDYERSPGTDTSRFMIYRCSADH